MGYVILLGMLLFASLTTYFYLKKCQEKYKNRRMCENCRRRHTLECPNSSRCYSIKEKPYFIPKNIKEERNE